MSGRPWPPTGLLWVFALLAAVGGGVTLVTTPDRPWGPMLIGSAFLVAAVALFRGLPPRSDVVAEHRRDPGTDEAERARRAVARRPVLTGGLGAVIAVLGATALGGLARFGPRRRTETGWADGVRLVDTDGRPVHRDDLAEGGIAVVWPEGPGRRELAAAVVVRLPADAAGGTGADGLDAYSRICTHAGCPVALFRLDEGVLYCPCHQATFDAAHDARPTFGPASRALPRLPIDTDADGFLVARGDFTAPPGPDPRRGST